VPCEEECQEAGGWTRQVYRKDAAGVAELQGQKGRSVHVRIMELIDLHPNKLGGFERYCIGFSKYLMERGHTHILVFSGEPCAEVADSLARCGVNWYVRDLRSLGTKEAMYVGKLARAHNVDVIHVRAVQC